MLIYRIRSLEKRSPLISALYLSWNRSEFELNILPENRSSQAYFIAIFKIHRRKQRKTIQSPSQPYL